MHLYGSERMLKAKNVSENRIPVPERSFQTHKRQQSPRSLWSERKGNKPDTSFSSYRTHLHFKPWGKDGDMRATALTAILTGPATWICCTNSWITFSKKTLSTVKAECFLPAYTAQMQKSYSTQHVSHFSMTICIIYQYIYCLHRCELFTWKIDLSIR